MITTRFLPRNEYSMYGDWLLRQDPDTLRNYFGVAITPGFVRNLVDRVEFSPGKHQFLVAEDGSKWVGALHMATHLNADIEFGIIVDREYRGRGIADQLMDEAVTWAQNRRYKRLYLHCLSWNQPIKHLCKKYRLEIQDRDGSGEVNVELPPPSMLSVGKEFASTNRNIFTRMLECKWDFAK
ncbi:WecD Histone acetyltransferase HPA2 and related acetyltransferases [uncultured Caudovirales phage]|uniref:WecD Histone acetyltransferase HPA2 and related acetyltransferases n=1 Tax=uncultured Caudovirales phage TaxID=2100421 RepID=A0A6J5LYL1_9CAUD|nr:WecD Histone acetyltransferase HPA2 and related acetyltransferases [uncultured Caudovirales phage]